MSPASLMLLALLACFGQLVSAQDSSQVNCKNADIFDYAVLIPHPTGCSSFFVCKDDIPIEVPCPAEGGENEELPVCSSKLNKNCLRRKLSRLCLTLDFVNFSNNDSVNQLLTYVL